MKRIFIGIGVMLAIMAMTVVLWLIWTRPIRNGEIVMQPLPDAAPLEVKS